MPRKKPALPSKGRELVGPGKTDRGPGLFDAADGDFDVAVVFKGRFDQAGQHRVVEQRPPFQIVGTGGRHDVWVRKASGTATSRFLEIRPHGAAGQPDADQCQFLESPFTIHRATVYDGHHAPSACSLLKVPFFLIAGDFSDKDVTASGRKRRPARWPASCLPDSAMPITTRASAPAPDGHYQGQHAQDETKRRSSGSAGNAVWRP